MANFIHCLVTFQYSDRSCLYINLAGGMAHMLWQLTGRPSSTVCLSYAALVSSSSGSCHFISFHGMGQDGRLGFGMHVLGAVCFVSFGISETPSNSGIV